VCLVEQLMQFRGISTHGLDPLVQIIPGRELLTRLDARDLALLPPEVTSKGRPRPEAWSAHGAQTFGELLTGGASHRE
jgi:hypothetical protein